MSASKDRADERFALVEGTDEALDYLQDMTALPPEDAPDEQTRWVTLERGANRRHAIGSIGLFPGEAAVVITVAAHDRDALLAWLAANLPGTGWTPARS